ncbi:hypothetical protein [Patulibacter defluvii]|uniref:hypothetical protein n=1 Tax=Patulibacter defluvii TaxID=3095358 RepID=UPI002A75A956|nr:hypothetical protein [Patulibacter sp. DM4]
MTAQGLRDREREQRLELVAGLVEGREVLVAVPEPDGARLSPVEAAAARVRVTALAALPDDDGEETLLVLPDGFADASLAETVDRWLARGGGAVVAVPTADAAGVRRRWPDAAVYVQQLVETLIIGAAAADDPARSVPAPTLDAGAARWTVLAIGLPAGVAGAPPPLLVRNGPPVVAAHHAGLVEANAVLRRANARLARQPAHEAAAAAALQHRATRLEQRCRELERQLKAVTADRDNARHLLSAPRHRAVESLAWRLGQSGPLRFAARLVGRVLRRVYGGRSS